MKISGRILAYLVTVRAYIWRPLSRCATGLADAADRVVRRAANHFIVNADASCGK